MDYRQATSDVPAKSATVIAPTTRTQDIELVKPNVTAMDRTKNESNEKDQVHVGMRGNHNE